MIKFKLFKKRYKNTIENSIDENNKKIKGNSILKRKKRNDENKTIKDEKKNNILFKCERIIRDSKIRSRLIISYGVLVLIPLLIIGYISIAQSQSAMSNKISKFSSQIMGQIGVNILKQMDKNSSIARAISVDADLQSYLENKKDMTPLAIYYKTNELSKTITNKATSTNDMASLGVVSNDNIKTGNFSPQLSDDIIKKLEELSDNAKGKFIWSLQKGTSGYSIFTSARVNDLISGESLGIILEELTPKAFVNLFKNVSLGNNSDIFVVDSKGIIISSGDMSLIGKEYKDKSVIEKIQSTEKTVMTHQNRANVIFQPVIMSI